MPRAKNMLWQGRWRGSPADLQIRGQDTLWKIDCHSVHEADTLLKVDCQFWDRIDTLLKVDCQIWDGVDTLFARGVHFLVSEIHDFGTQPSQI